MSSVVVPSFTRLFVFSSDIHPADESESLAAWELLAVLVPRQAPSWLYSMVGGGCLLQSRLPKSKEGRKKKQSYADEGQLKFFFFFLKKLLKGEFRFLQLVTGPEVPSSWRMTGRVWPGAKWTQVM